MVVILKIKFGGNLEFDSYEAVESAYVKGDIHPLDLKQATAFYINELVQPVREHFDKDKRAKELMDFVKKQKVTR